MEKALWGVGGGAVAVFGLWWMLALRGDGHRLAGALGLLLVLALGVAGVVRLARGDGGAAALGLTGVLSAWIVLAITGLGVQDQQLLHDRGVTSDGTVVRAVVTSDPMNGRGPSVTAVDVELADGSVAHQVQTGQAHPALGDRLQVTRDPRGVVDTRLGPRPAAPDRTVAAVLLAVLTGCALFTAFAPD
ncbi:hypothetical protein HUT16_35005 [Kitasatospora sp. NA04385]|uniref:hypothetical protein n=1 Tax=Kitasatospora sp. NA04385 TaxID=2742135 RepID=UPI00159001E5|nr:hypothetical protein [Kitasatospora sp. NA04385]QKW23616.1 hypothetical protein HUT16_35005 [Kitasatospora sp. NA04385]